MCPESTHGNKRLDLKYARLFVSKCRQIGVAGVRMNDFAVQELDGKSMAQVMRLCEECRADLVESLLGNANAGKEAVDAMEVVSVVQGMAEKEERQKEKDMLNMINKYEREEKDKEFGQMLGDNAFARDAAMDEMLEEMAGDDDDDDDDDVIAGIATAKGVEWQLVCIYVFHVCVVHFVDARKFLIEAKVDRQDVALW